MPDTSNTLTVTDCNPFSGTDWHSSGNGTTYPYYSGNGTTYPWNNPMPILPTFPSPIHSTTSVMSNGYMEYSMELFNEVKDTCRVILYHTPGLSFIELLHQVGLQMKFSELPKDQRDDISLTKALMALVASDQITKLNNGLYSLSDQELDNIRKIAAMLDSEKDE